MIGGHEHDPLESVVGQTLITKAGSDGVFVVRIDLQVTADGRVLGRQHRFIPVTAELPEEPAMAALVARYEARLDAELGVAVGQSTVPLDARNGAVRTSETNTGNLVADAIRARLRADVAVMNGGGIRGNRVLPAGPLTRRDVRTLLPFLNVLVKLEVPGEVLLAVLERSVGTYPAENGGFLQVSGLTFTSTPGARSGSGWWRPGGRGAAGSRQTLHPGHEQLHRPGGRRLRHAGRPSPWSSRRTDRAWPRRWPTPSPPRAIAPVVTGESRPRPEAPVRGAPGRKSP